MAVDSAWMVAQMHKQIRAAQWQSHWQTGQNDNSVTQQNLADMRNAYLQFTDQDEQTYGK